MGEGGFFQKNAFFHKNVSFLANIECCPKFIEYALLILSIKLFEFFFQNEFLKYLKNKCAHETGKELSSNPASNQSKICPKFQRCM